MIDDSGMTSETHPAPGALSRTGVIILCGGWGKRMRQETLDRISKVELPIALPPIPGGQEASETVIGMLVRTFTGLRSLQDITLLTSNRWVSAHTKLAEALAVRYSVDVRCQSDAGTGDEFPPSAVAELAETISERIDQRQAAVLVSGDILFGPHSLRSFENAVQEGAPPIAFGVAEGIEFLGLLYFSPNLNFRQLAEEIAARTVFDLLGGLWPSVPVLTVEIDGPVYDCGSVEGYRAACEAGRSGRLW